MLQEMLLVFVSINLLMDRLKIRCERCRMTLSP